MANEGELYAMNLKGFWMDVGQPKDFLAGTYVYLNHLKSKDPKCLTIGENILGNVLIVKNKKSIKKIIIFVNLGPNSTNRKNCLNWS